MKRWLPLVGALAVAACSTSLAGTGAPGSIPSSPIPSSPVASSPVLSSPGRPTSGPLAIDGIEHFPNLSRNHQLGVIDYAQRPPVGGAHSPVWADCAGTVYAAPIADENAVHSLEHGAVWITYGPDATELDVAWLVTLVRGRDRMMMSPYPALESPVSVQFWGYRLTVDDARDARVLEFIEALRLNPTATSELSGSCANPAFRASPSTPGRPR